MNRYPLKHVIRAAGTIAEVQNLIILDSQSILGQFPLIPQTLLETKPIDIFIPPTSLSFDGSGPAGAQ